MRRVLGINILAASVLVGIYLICFYGNATHYMQCIADSEQIASIVGERAQTKRLLDALIFDEETLFYDAENNVFYYSLVEGHAGAYNPKVELRGRYEDLGIAFLTDGITDDAVKDNQAVYFVVFTDKEYSEHYLKCTNLPMMNIVCNGAENPEDVLDDPVPMSMTVFDNQAGAVKRLVLSDGTIQIRGGSTRGYPKKGYDISLVQESVGGHFRDNNISLLGMRQDDDWVLYAAYNDQEKIRNVFSANLWKASCATDNARRIDTGVEYKYLELFMNGRYWGLYALGYSIDKKQLQVDAGNGREALYKVVTWADRDSIYFTNGNGYEVRGTKAGEDWNRLLMEYYGDLCLKPDDNERLYAGIDPDNAIDICLFFNLIQGVDNVSVNLVKNLYVSIRREEDGGLTALYAPWDMDISWGNLWEAEARMFTVPYGILPEINCVMESGYLNQLFLNGDEEIWEKFFEKYRQLRSAAWSEECIGRMLDEYEADIFGSGAYLRDMERWPEGAYADAREGLSTFRRYVAERLQETDAYYDRLKAMCKESVFVRRSAQYKDFMESSFIIEINDKDLLEDLEYTALLEYMGVDMASVTDEVHYIIANPSKGEYDYLASLVDGGADEEFSAGTLGVTAVRDGVYAVSLNGVECYGVTMFAQSDIKMSVIGDRTVQEFSFVKGHGDSLGSDAFQDLSVYVEALSATGYYAVIEVNNTDIWQNLDYVKLFGKLGLTEQSINEATDFIVWNGLEKTALALDNFHVSGSRSDTPAGELSLFENEKDIYGIYLDDEELLLSSEEEREAADIRILLLDADSHEIVECVE